MRKKRYKKRISATRRFLLSVVAITMLVINIVIPLQVVLAEFIVNEQLNDEGIIESEDEVSDDNAESTESEFDVEDSTEDTPVDEPSTETETNAESNDNNTESANQPGLEQEESVNESSDSQTDNSDTETETNVESSEEIKQGAAIDPTLTISNELSVVETNTVVEGMQRFSQKLTIKGEVNDIWEDVDLVTKVKVPYEGWLNTDSFVLSDIQSIAGVTSSWEWEDETTLVITYHFPRIYAGATVDIPYVLISGSTIGENKKAEVLSYFTKGNADEQWFTSNTIELGGKINTWSHSAMYTTAEVIQGDGTVSSSDRTITMNILDTSINENNQVINHHSFNLKELRITSRKIPTISNYDVDGIYVGDTTFKITLPEGVEPADDSGSYYNKETRTFEFTIESLDLRMSSPTNTGRTTTIEVPFIEQIISGLAIGTYTMPITVTAYNDLDDATYELLNGGLRLTIKKISTAGNIVLTDSYNFNYDIYYMRDSELNPVSSYVKTNNVTLQNNWNWRISTENSDGSDDYLESYIRRFSVYMRPYEGSINIYYSENGDDITGTIAENVVYKSSLIYNEPGLYKYILIVPNDDFYQERALENSNYITTYPTLNLNSTEPIYSGEETLIWKTQTTSEFTFNDNPLTRTSKVTMNKARNKVNLYGNKYNDNLSGSSTQNVIFQNQTFTDEFRINDDAVDYYGETSEIIVLYPSGVTFESVVNLPTTVQSNYRMESNYKGTGKSAIIFTHSSGISSSPANHYLRLQFKTSKNISLDNLDIEYYYSFADIYKDHQNGTFYNSSVTDTNDMNNNGDTEELIGYVSTTREFVKTKEVVGLTTAKDASESNYSDSLITSKIFANTKIIDYAVEIRNYADSTFDRVEAIVRIPKQGDMSFSNPGMQLATTTDTYLSYVEIPDMFDVYYTTDDVTNITTTGFSQVSWESYTAETNLHAVTALRFVSKTDYTLEVNGIEKIKFSVVAKDAKIGDIIETQSIYGYSYGTISGDLFITDVKPAEIVSANQNVNFSIISVKNSSQYLNGTIKIFDKYNQTVGTVTIDGASEGTVFEGLEPGEYTVRQESFEDGYTSFDDTTLTIEESETIEEYQVVLINYPEVSSFELQDLTLYVGDEWNPEKNILKVYDLEGNVLNVGEYVVSSDSEVDTSSVGEHQVLISVNRSEALKATVNVVYGIVVDPSDKGNILDSNPDFEDKMMNEEISLLKINYVTDLVFEGEYQATKETILTATTDTNWGSFSNGSWNPKEINPFINIEDRRDNSTGYTLTATMESSFSTEDGRVLSGAELIFTSGDSTYGDLTQIKQSMVLGAGDSETILTTEQADGSNSLSFSKVELSLPKGKSYTAGNYSTTVNWNLSEGPV